MLKIGIIGSIETVDKINEVTKEFDDNTEFVFYKYLDKSETTSLTEVAQDICDVLVYTGIAPYTEAIKSGCLYKTAIYIQRNGTSLYKAFWQIRDDGILFNNISVDVLKKIEIKETAEDLGIIINDIYVNELTIVVNVSYNELILFHYKLWQSGKIDVAITGFSKVYQKLKDLGVPCYRLFPTKSLIRTNLNEAISLKKIEKANNTQTAVQIVKLRINGDDIDVVKAELEIILLKYAKENLGSLYPNGEDEYLIFTNKGSLINKSNCFDIKHSLYLHTKNAILSSGIGYGDNVKDAEDKAKIALKHSITKEYSCIYLVDNHNNVTGPISSSYNITFSLSAGKSDKIRKLSEKINISPVYVSKLKNLMEKLEKNILDANAVKDYLGISERSARRVLGKLVESGYAKVKYTESRAKTGRPRKIYEINL